MRRQKMISRLYMTPQTSTNSRSKNLFRQLNLNVWSGQRIPSGLPTMKRKTISTVVFRFSRLWPPLPVPRVKLSTDCFDSSMCSFADHVAGVEASCPAFTPVCLCFRSFSLKDVTGGKPGHVMPYLRRAVLRAMLRCWVHVVAPVLYSASSNEHSIDLFE